MDVGLLRLVGAVIGLQPAEDGRRQDGEGAEHEEGLVQAADQGTRIGAQALRDEEHRRQAATATPKLNDNCCIVLAMELALLAERGGTSA